MELLNVCTAGLRRCHRFDLGDLNRVDTSAVTWGHVAITLRNSTNGQVLAVHVVGSGAGIVTQSNSAVLHPQRSFFFEAALDRDDLTGGFLELTQLP